MLDLGQRMSTPHAIPFAVLLRATAALRAAKDAPTGTHLSVSTWAEVMRSHNEMRYHLERLLESQEAPVATA